MFTLPLKPFQKTPRHSFAIFFSSLQIYSGIAKWIIVKLQWKTFWIFLKLLHWALIFQLWTKFFLINILNLSFHFLSSKTFFFHFHFSQHPSKFLLPTFLMIFYIFFFPASTFSSWTRFPKAYTIKQLSKSHTDSSRLKHKALCK